MFIAIKISVFDSAIIHHSIFFFFIIFFFLYSTLLQSEQPFIISISASLMILRMYLINRNNKLNNFNNMIMLSKSPDTLY